MKIPLKKILSWFARTVAVAAVQGAAERLTRPKISENSQESDRG